MGKTFIRKQQDIIDQDMRDMSPEMVNEILEDMKPHEAHEFLGRLGHVRARAIYDAQERKGCLKVLLLPLCGALFSLAAYLWLSSLLVS